MTDWKQWAAEHRAALADEDQAACEALADELDAALQADPQCLGVRTDADLGAVLAKAADTAASDAAWAVLAEGLAHRAPLLAGRGWARKPERRRWLIEGWLPEGRIGLLAGKGGSGKSRLALQLAAALAGREGRSGVDWLPGAPPAGPGRITPGRQAPVVIASWEDELDELRRRRYWMHHRDGGNLSWAAPSAGKADALHAVDMRRLGSLWGPDAGQHTSTTAHLLETGRWLRRYCESLGARLLVVDPLAAAYGSNENDRGLVRAFMADWDGWASQARCSVLLVAHPPKADGAAWSGSTDWHAAARYLWTLGLERTGGRTRAKGPPPHGWRLKLSKSNYGPAGNECWLRGLGRGWDGWERCEAVESWLSIRDQANGGVADDGATAIDF